MAVYIYNGCLYIYIYIYIYMYNGCLYMLQWDVTSQELLTIKPIRCTNFSNLFWNKILHVSDIFSVHHQEFFTVHTAMVYVIQLASRIMTFPTRYTNFSNLFWNKTLHELESSSVHHQVFSTVHTAMVVCHTGLLTYIIAVCTVENSWWWTEELSETCGLLFQK
jgi:hypothetical protein